MTHEVDVVCLSHLRWGFVFQRPNHLMSLCANERRVFFVEEPVFDARAPRMEIVEKTSRLFVCTPHVPPGTPGEDVEAIQRDLLREMLAVHHVERPLLWFYTPMAIAWVEGLAASCVVYDCMDELSAFRGAPPELRAREEELLRRANVVFTGGHSLQAAKRERHPHVLAFPSSVDIDHFAVGTSLEGVPIEEPIEQRALPRPRIGFYGVIDERMDLDLLQRLADERPNYAFIMIGPVVKIDEDALPRRPNLHYLGSRRYRELPRYLAGWDVAMMPFALNESTRFISPTKTLEYMAAHKPIVSTAIRDVVTPYGEEGIVRIADAASFAAAVDEALGVDEDAHARLCEEVLATTSWRKTWRAMWRAVMNHSTLGSPERTEARTAEASHV